MLKNGLVEIYLHQLQFLWFFFFKEVVTIYPNVFIVFVIETSHFSRSWCPVPRVLMNGYYIRDLRLAEYNGWIIIRKGNGEEYLKNKRVRKKNFG